MTTWRPRLRLLEELVTSAVRQPTDFFHGTHSRVHLSLRPKGHPRDVLGKPKGHAQLPEVTLSCVGRLLHRCNVVPVVLCVSDREVLCEVFLVTARAGHALGQSTYGRARRDVGFECGRRPWLFVAASNFKGLYSMGSSRPFWSSFSRAC